MNPNNENNTPFDENSAYQSNAPYDFFLSSNGLNTQLQPFADLPTASTSYHNPQPPPFLLTHSPVTSRAGDNTSSSTSPPPRRKKGPPRKKGEKPPSMRGSPDRETRMNTPAAKGTYDGRPLAMANVAYGFCPEIGWSGVLFQVYIKKEFVKPFSKERELEFSLSFGEDKVSPVIHHLTSEIDLPELGRSRYILQCLVPGSPQKVGAFPVILRISGRGGRTVGQSGMYLGHFTYIPSDGSLKTYFAAGPLDSPGHRAWLKTVCIPQDIDMPQHYIPSEVCAQRDTRIYIAVVLPPQQQFVPSFNQTNAGILPPLPWVEGPAIPPENTVLAAAQPSDSNNYNFNVNLTQDLRQRTDDQIEQYYQEFSSQTYPTIQETLATMPPGSFPFAPQPTADMAHPAPGAPSQPIPDDQGSIPTSLPAPQNANASVPQTTKREVFPTVVFKDDPLALADYQTWTINEQLCSRRIVQFWLEDSENPRLLNVKCKPVSQFEWNDSMTTVSCIYWNPDFHGDNHNLKEQYVFTSVEVIRLLEMITTQRFQTPEKNRIRRNVENYRPKCIKKEGDTALFWNMLTRYLNPKVVNIAKDVKVFLWKDLCKSVKKVLRNYNVVYNVVQPVAAGENVNA